MKEDKFTDKKSEISEVVKLVNKLIVYWKWFVIFLLFSLFISYLVNRYSAPKYRITTTILNKKVDEFQGNLDFISGGEYFNTTRDLSKELIVLKSYSLISKAILNLKWDISIYRQGNIKVSEIYPNTSPFLVEIDSISTRVPINRFVKVSFANPERFTIEIPEEENIDYVSREYEFGESINIKGFKFHLIPNPSKYNVIEPEYLFKINDLDNLVTTYQSRLDVRWEEKGSAVLRISLIGNNQYKEIDFLKMLTFVAINKSIVTKNRTAIKTINFVDSQLSSIADSLKSISDMMQTYKLRNKDLALGSELIFEKVNTLEEQKYDLILNNQYLDYLYKYIRDKNKGEVIAPNTIGLNSSLLDNLIQQYVDLKIDDNVHNSDLYSTSPIFIYEKTEKQKRIEELEKNIVESIENIRLSNNILIDENDAKINILLNSLENLLKDELEFADYERVYKLNEEFYNILLTKKAESSIAKASTDSDYEILDNPRIIGEAISPRKDRNYIIALLIGILVPIIIIYAIDYLNPYVMTKDDFDHINRMPFLGIIGHNKHDTNLVIKDFPKSDVSESIRIVKANIRYYDGIVGEKKTIIVSSAMSGEGKSFFSINLSNVYANIGKKTILLGADMRRPTFAKYFNINRSAGLSNFLSQGVDIEKIICQTFNSNLDIIPGGEIPPNPFDLLLNGRFINLMECLKSKYEVIIVDSPPIGMVSDTYELLKFSDLLILIVRQNKTYKAAFSGINTLYNEGKLKNSVVVFNDVDFRKYNYGYGKYSYNYSNKQYGKEYVE